MNLKEYTCKNGDVILYIGSPDLEMLDALADGPGDVWHSSFEQGFKNAFKEIVYQTAVFFWYVKDFDGLAECGSWRINPAQFAVRKTVWEFMGGFDRDYKNPVMRALDFGFYGVRHGGVTVLYAEGLFADTTQPAVQISAKDRYIFFRKNFKTQHSIYMLYRKGIWKPNEWAAFFYARKHYKMSGARPILPARELQPMFGQPTVSYIIPTMSRQDYTLQLINDLVNQTYRPTQVVVVDATPEDKRDDSLYNPSDYPFEVIFLWQATKGSCRARNEAIAVCKGDYIIFGDDDIRLRPDFIENHIRFQQTYRVDGANGLDIRADHYTDVLDALDPKLSALGDKRLLSGLAQLMSNSNACVKREWVAKLAGNDINFDGGYGEDNDFGLSLAKAGVVMMQNPYSVNLHLKPPAGGYRVWGMQSKIMGKKRKKQPWELDSPVKWIRPVPSPTLMYYFHKHFGTDIVSEYRHKYFFLYLFKGPKWSMLFRILRLPYRQLQFNKSKFYAKKLMVLGKRVK
jgi:glycosyltransferase involved in cell wall biosynthesis